MASVLSVEKESDDSLTLIEQDIVGAELPKPPEYCTVAILKRWLACRGAKVSGLRVDLIQRVNDYINNGLSSNVIDPDGGINLQKKRLRLGLDEEVSPLTDEAFPESGFQVGIYGLPRIGYAQIWKYLIEDVELKKQLSVEKPIVKGYNFYKSGKVLGVYSKAENNLFYIKSQVMPSYSKSGPVYAVKLIINRNSNIHKAYCPCPAGVDGRCNHLAATLFAVEDMAKSVGSTEQEENVDDLPCTSKPCAWSVPKKRRLEPFPIQDIKFEKYAWGKIEKARVNASPDQDVRAPHQRLQNYDYGELFVKLKEVESKTGKKMGLTYTIPHSLPEFSPMQEEIIIDNRADKWRITSPIKDGPLSLEEIRDRSCRAKERLYNSAKNIKVIAEETVDQHKTSVWFNVRQPRITASKCKRCLIKPSTSPTKAISEVLLYNHSVQTKAMKEGIEWEQKIIDKFEEENNSKVKKSGFLISETHPFLGASPDGITEENHLVEVKKIVYQDGESLEAAMCRKAIYKKIGTELVINRNHQYYYQIQQQLFCSKLTICHFIVSNGIEQHTDIITVNETFWNETLPKLQEFYFEHLFPELVYPRILHGEMRWNKNCKFPRID